MEKLQGVGICVGDLRDFLKYSFVLLCLSMQVFGGDRADARRRFARSSTPCTIPRVDARISVNSKHMSY
jgi:hypothetical protein